MRGTARTGIVAAASLTAVLVLVHQARVADGQVGGDPSQIRVVWTGDPSHRAVISWTTEDEGTTHRLLFDTTSHGGVAANYAQSLDVTDTGAYGTDTAFFHHASLRDLEPDTEYFFVVESDGHRSQELWFRTAPGAGETFKLLYGGDSRTGRSDRQAMNRLISKIQTEDPEVVALVHGGDYIDHANTWWQWDAWLDDHELTISADGRVLPIVPAKGNHEGRGVLYNKVFANPGGSPEVNWFYTRFGDLALVNLDTEVSLAGDQLDWLEGRLREGREAPWLIVNYHRPAYPAVKSPSGAKEHWVPLFEQFDVDLVCESDGHTLKRTPPIREDRVDFTGVTYVGEGGLGVPQRTPREDLWYLESPGMATSAHHVQVLTVASDKLLYEARLMDGTVADAVTILPRAERLAQRLAPIEARVSAPGRVELSFTRPVASDSLKDATFDVSPALEIERTVEGAEVDDVLGVANTATFDELDDAVGLDSRAAANIVTRRAGPDGKDSTADDEPFETWEALDAVPWVGPRALESMRKYAQASGSAHSNSITLRTGELEVGQPYRVAISGLRDIDGGAIAPGSVVTFTAADGRADSLGGMADSAEPSAGCATMVSGRLDLAWPLLAMFGVFAFRRRRAVPGQERRV